MENNYNFPDVIKIKELTKSEDVNEYIGLGWALLTLVTVNIGDPGAVDQRVKYVVGWNKNNGEIKIPKSPADEYDLPF